MFCSEHVIQKLDQCNFACTYLAYQKQSYIIVHRFLSISSHNSVPCQCESLVDAIVVDELDLESPIRVEGQSAPREHQVDLELVGWGQDEIENHDTKVISKLMYNMKHFQVGWIKSLTTERLSLSCKKIETSTTRREIAVVPKLTALTHLRDDDDTPLFLR